MTHRLPVIARLLGLTRTSILFGLVLLMSSCGGESQPKTERKVTAQPSGQSGVKRAVTILGSMDGVALRGADQTNRKAFARSKWKDKYGASYIGLVSVALGPNGLIAICSANTGVLLVDARDPKQMKALGNPRLDSGATPVRYPGYHRCENLVFDGDVLYISHYGDPLFPQPFLAGFRVSRESVDQLFFHQEPMPKWLTVKERSFQGFSGVDVVGDLLMTTTFRSLLIWSRKGDTLIKESETHFSNRAQLQDVAFCDGNILLAAGFAGLVVVDPKDYQKKGALVVPGSVRSVSCGPTENQVYAVAGDYGVYIVDLTDPDKPRRVGHVNTPGSANDVVVVGTKMWVADWTHVRVYEIADMQHPVLLETVKVPNARATGVNLGLAARGDTVFALDWYGVHAMEFTDGTARGTPEVDRSVLFFSTKSEGDEAVEHVTVSNPSGVSGVKIKVSVSDPAFSVQPTEFSLDGAKEIRLEVRYKGSDDVPRNGTLSWSYFDAKEQKTLLHLSANERSRNVGDLAPDMNLFFEDGHTERLREQYKGKTVVLSFFSSFCPTCYREFPDLEARIWKPYKGQNVVVVGVCEMKSDKENLSEFRARTGVTFPLVRGGRGIGSFSTMSAVEDVSFYPFHVIIKPDGTIAYMSKTTDIGAMQGVLSSIAKQRASEQKR